MWNGYETYMEFVWNGEGSPDRGSLLPHRWIVNIIPSGDFIGAKE